MTAQLTMSNALTNVSTTIPDHQPWALTGTYLTPTHAALQAHATRMQHQSTTDPLITLTLHIPPNPPNTITIHQSLLTSSPQLATINPVQPLDEYPDTFDIIRKYLYLQPIDVSIAPPDAALSAARWGLIHLHNGLYCITGSPNRWLGLMAAAPATDAFKRQFVRTFVAAVDRHPNLLHGHFNDPIQDLRTMIRIGNLPTWPVLNKQDIVVDVVRALIRFGERDYGTTILDVVMRGHRLIGDQTVKQVLEALEWETGYGQVLEKCGHNWDGHAWKLLMGVRDRVRFGWDEIRLCLECDYSGRWETGKNIVICADSLRFILAVENGKKGMGVSVRSVADIVQGKKRVRVRVSVGGVCDCVDDGVDVVAQEEVTLAAFGRVGGVGVRVLDAGALKEFAAKHERCRLRVCVRLLLLRDIHHVSQVHQVECWQMMFPSNRD